MLRNPRTLVNKPYFSIGQIIFIISHIFPFEIISVVISDRKIIFWPAASIVDASAVNHIKTFLPNNLFTLIIKGKLFFTNSP